MSYVTIIIEMRRIGSGVLSALKSAERKVYGYERGKSRDNLVYLSDEDGNEVAFEYLDSVEYKGEEYVVLISTDEDDDEVVILKVEPTPGDEEEEDFVTVESEEVAQAVFDIFKERNKDYFNFAD